MISLAPLSDAERLAWWRLSRTAGIGPITFAKLISQYGAASNALDWLPELSRRGGRKTPLVAFGSAQAEDEIAALHKIHGRIIATCEPDYPDLLRKLDDAPPVITVLGNPATWKKPCVGIVGARNASLAGRKLAHIIAHDLGTHGYTIVSGLARGIDTAAHEGSIETGTVCVVAGGADVIYPPENEKLYRDICARGAVISEHPVGLEPKAPHFPRRNRIIAGIAAGTCIVEATSGSGSLIIAHMAADYGRDVFAVPGSPMDPRAAGPNRLIREGAILVECAEHIIDHLTLFKPPGQLLDPAPSDYKHNIPLPNDPDLADARTSLRNAISFTPIVVDEMARACQVNIQAVHIAVLELELAGVIERLPGNRIVLIQKDYLSEPDCSRHR